MKAILLAVWLSLLLSLTAGLAYGQNSLSYNSKTGSYVIDNRTPELDTKKSKGKLPSVTTYRNSELEFEVSYPKNWYPAQSSRKAVFLLRRDSGTDLASISFNARNFTGDKNQFMKDMKGAGKTFEKRYQERFPNAKAIKEGVTTLGSFPAYYMVFQYTVSNLGINIDQVIMQVMGIRGDKIYLVNLESNLSCYDEALKEFNSIMATFNFQ